MSLANCYLEGRKMSSRSGAVSEEEIRAIMMQKAPISGRDFIDHSPGRFRSYEVYGVSCFVLLLDSFSSN